ncbi:MAG: transcription termination factor NusA [Dehalococcoidales bacterium]
MKSDFILAITQLSAEKNLPKEVVLSAVEAALVSAYRRDNFAPHQNISVKINPNSGGVEVWAEKTVAERPDDSRYEITLAEALSSKPDAQIGDTIMVEATPHNAGRIAAQTAKQVILQRLHEAEHTAIIEEYTDKEGDIITGLVQRIEPGQIYIDLGRTEAILPVAEQVRSERYRVGQRVKVYILQVVRTTKGPRVAVSRSHPNLLRRLFELEVPEVFNGTVVLQAIAREAGHRSKVAVAARQEGIDPVGCCVGLRGIRIQNIVNELNGEKIDVIMWDPNVSVYITNALSPAQILNVELNDRDLIATVVVPDKQLSLAIGKEGQNARLAAKLTGWRIDIKSASAAEAEKAAQAVLLAEAEKEAVAEEIAAEPVAEVPVILEEVSVPEGEPAEKGAEPAPSPKAEPTPQPVFLKPQLAEEKPQIRFAEDTTAPAWAKPEVKSKKKKKTVRAKESAEDGIKLKKQKRGAAITEEDEEDY